MAMKKTTRPKIFRFAVVSDTALSVPHRSLKLHHYVVRSAVRPVVSVDSFSLCATYTIRE